jgi:prophage regulatory protein
VGASVIVATTDGRPSVSPAPERCRSGANRCLRLNEVCARVGLGETAIREMVKIGAFPAPFKIGQRAIAWLDDDVTAWIAHRAARRVMFKI